MSLELNTIYHQDCLQGMTAIDDKSIDMILCDLPYGTTANKWDTVIPFDKLWAQYERVIKDNGAIVLTASQPFTSALVMSKPKLFRYDLVWQKTKPVGFLNANRQPLRSHESVLVFYKSLPTYNPQMQVGAPYKSRPKAKTTNYRAFKAIPTPDNVGTRYPTSVVTFNLDSNLLHPTQKPLALFEWLIKTYTNEGETVLDNCMGSGTTAIACMSTGRNFIGFETDAKYYEGALKRIAETQLATL